jgi:hypothetical protein
VLLEGRTSSHPLPIWRTAGVGDPAAPACAAGHRNSHRAGLRLHTTTPRVAGLRLHTPPAPTSAALPPCAAAGMELRPPLSRCAAGGWSSDRADLHAPPVPRPLPPRRRR